MSFLRNWIYLVLMSLAAGTCQAAISQQQYDNILDLIEQVYGPEFRAQEWRLQVTRYWEGNRPEASAWKHEDSEGEISVIQINGGVARHPEVNRDGFALIACHTIGHHLAGPPLTWKFSIEGQADYFGASACMRKILPLMEPSTNTEQEAHTGAADKCKTMGNSTELQLCKRTIIAGLSAARFYAEKEGGAMPTLATSEPGMAKGTIIKELSPQCRLDTYVAAATCDHANNEEMPEDKRWLCPEGNGSSPAARPKCWYNP